MAEWNRWFASLNVSTSRTRIYKYDLNRAKDSNILVIFIKKRDYLPIMGTALRRNTMKLRILLALLGKPDGSLTRYGIAKLVGCTPSWVVQLIHQFEQKGLVSGTKVKTVDG